MKIKLSFRSRRNIIIVIIFLLSFIVYFNYVKVESPADVAKTETKNSNVTGVSDVIDYIGVLASIAGLFYLFFQISKVATETERRRRQESNKYAVNMIKEWNDFSLENTRILLKEFKGYYKECKTVAPTLIKESINKKPEIEVSIIKLFNYFEYVSSAYNSCADKNIIVNSFAVTMARYYKMLEGYLLNEILNTRRNAWRPFTMFLKEIIENERISKEGVKCNSCCSADDICFMDINSDTFEILKLINDPKLDKLEFSKIEENKKRLDKPQ